MKTNGKIIIGGAENEAVFNFYRDITFAGRNSTSDFSFDTSGKK